MKHSIEINISESDYQLKSLLKTARLYQKPRIKMLIYMLQGITSTQELAKKTKCNRDSIRNWKNLYASSGIQALLSDERGGRTFGSIAEADKKKILAKLAHPLTDFKTYKELGDWINETFSLTLSYSNLNAYIKRHFATKFKPGKKRKLKKAA